MELVSLSWSLTFISHLKLVTSLATVAHHIEPQYTRADILRPATDPSIPKPCNKFIPIRDMPNSDAACDAFFRPGHEYDKWLCNSTFNHYRISWPEDLGVESIMAGSAFIDHKHIKGADRSKYKRTRSDARDRVIDHSSLLPEYLKHDECEFECSDTQPELVMKEMLRRLSQSRVRTMFKLICKPPLVIKFAQRYSIRQYATKGEVDPIPDGNKLVWKCFCTAQRADKPWQEIESDQEFQKYLSNVQTAKVMLAKDLLSRPDSERPHLQLENNLDYMAALFVRRHDPIQDVSMSLGVAKARLARKTNGAGTQLITDIVKRQREEAYDKFISGAHVALKSSDETGQSAAKVNAIWQDDWEFDYDDLCEDLIEWDALEGETQEQGSQAHVASHLVAQQSQQATGKRKEITFDITRREEFDARSDLLDRTEYH